MLTAAIGYTVLPLAFTLPTLFIAVTHISLKKSESPPTILLLIEVLQQLVKISSVISAFLMQRLLCIYLTASRIAVR